MAKQTDEERKKSLKIKQQKRKGKVAYTPLTDAQKKAAMEQLIKDLHSGKKGGYRSPGPAYYDDRLRRIIP